uniref:Secreted protein n=1 Tax=Steinernema glaseri TaxID=37863 RepID=A0A1I7ZXJ2_9BILA
MNVLKCIPFQLLTTLLCGLNMLSCNMQPRLYFCLIDWQPHPIGPRRPFLTRLPSRGDRSESKVRDRARRREEIKGTTAEDGGRGCPTLSYYSISR